MGRAWVRIDKQRNWQRDIFKKVLATYFNICYFNFEQSLHHTQMGLKSEIWTGLLIRCYFVNILWTRGKEYEVLIDCGGKSLEDLTVETITASSLLQTIQTSRTPSVSWLPRWRTWPRVSWIWRRWLVNSLGLSLLSRRLWKGWFKIQTDGKKIPLRQGCFVCFNLFTSCVLAGPERVSSLTYWCH